MTSTPRYRREDGEFDRAIGFVDATYALALTLLVTTLEVGEDRGCGPTSARSATPSGPSSSPS
jgi:hypothetical protein